MTARTEVDVFEQEDQDGRWFSRKHWCEPFFFNPNKFPGKFVEVL